MNWAWFFIQQLWQRFCQGPCVHLARGILVLAVTGSLVGCAGQPLLAALLAAGQAVQPTPLPVIPVQPVPSNGALNAKNNAAFRFSRYSVDDGLSESVVRAIFQDSLGFMWFGTEDGLNKFDGYTFKTYRSDPDDPGSLSQNYITAVYEDRSGALWVGTRSGGLNRMDRRTQKFTRYYHDPGNPGSLDFNDVSAIIQSRDGALWVGSSSQGIDRIDLQNGGITYFANDPYDPGSLVNNHVFALYEDPSGKIWVATAMGLDCLEFLLAQGAATAPGGQDDRAPASQKFVHYRHDPRNPGSLSNDQVWVVTGGSDGSLWVGTDEGGLNRLNPLSGRFTRYRFQPDNVNNFGSNGVRKIIVDNSGTVWAGMTDTGLNSLDLRSGLIVQHRHDSQDAYSLSEDRILSLYQDRSGALWIGTYGGGINKLDPALQQFEHYYHSPNNPGSIKSNIITAVVEDQQGLVWTGLSNSGLSALDRKNSQYTIYQHDQKNLSSLSSNQVNALFVDHEGALWVGTSKGLNRYNLKTDRFTRFSPNRREVASLSNEVVNAIAEDQQGILWVGTDRGLNHYDRESGIFTQYLAQPSDPHGLTDDRISALYVDATDTLWVGTYSGGLFRYDRQADHFTHFTIHAEYADIRNDQWVMSILVDHRGALWLGTPDGLSRLDPSSGNFTYFREKDGLANSTVYSILEDSDGYLWLATNKGLSRFDPLARVFKNYDVRDGLQSNEFNRGVAFKNLQGELFFGGINGLTVFNPSHLSQNSYIPPVWLTSITREGQPLVQDLAPEAVQEIVLQSPGNAFEFEFSALNLIRPEKNQYAYWLEGFDRDWNYIGTRHNGSYTNLPGRTYTLHLKGSNNDGVWNESKAALRVIVVPPFWQTLWFQGSFILLLAAAVYGGYRLRLKSIEAHNIQLERLVRERTYLFEQRTQELEALYQADERMLRYMSMDQVLQTLVDVAVDMLAADKSAIWVLDEEKHGWEIQVWRGYSSEAVQLLRFPYDAKMMSVAASGKVVVVDDTTLDPAWRSEPLEIRQAMHAEGVCSFMLLPIQAGGSVFGIFNVSAVRARAFGTEDAQRLFTALAQRAAMSVENAQLIEQTKEVAVIEERSRLARDLHDSAKQKAFAALAQLGAVGGMVNVNPKAARVHLDEAENLVYEVIQELTFLIQEMYPMALKEKGLVMVLREYVFEWENRNDIQIELDIQNARKLPLEMEQAVYRIIQEALANVVRHSQAGRVYISIIYQPDKIEVSVDDDGKGFDVGRKPAGMGLRSMKERVDMIHGQLNIASVPGTGTRINFSAPIKNGYGRTYFEGQSAGEHRTAD